MYNYVYNSSALALFPGLPLFSHYGESKALEVRLLERIEIPIHCACSHSRAQVCVESVLL